MAKTQSDFPVTIDATLQTDRASGDTITSASYDVIEDAIFELETKVGVDSSAVTGSIDYKLEHHHTQHENGGNGEISVAGLSGLLADDQHVLDAEVLSYLLARTGAGVNKKLFIDAAGTAVEWATGIKIGTITKDTADASGPQTVTGVGFKPSHLIFFGIVHNAPGEMSIGIDDGTVRKLIVDACNISANYWYLNASASIELIQTAIIYSIGYISSFDADGFTISWIKEGAKTGIATILYMAFR